MRASISPQGMRTNSPKVEVVSSRLSTTSTPVSAIQAAAQISFAPSWACTPAGRVKVRYPSSEKALIKAVHQQHQRHHAYGR